VQFEVTVTGLPERAVKATRILLENGELYDRQSSLVI
jgi:hypothetical protein